MYILNGDHVIFIIVTGKYYCAYCCRCEINFPASG